MHLVIDLKSFFISIYSGVHIFLFYSKELHIFLLIIKKTKFFYEFWTLMNLLCIICNHINHEFNKMNFRNMKLKSSVCA